MLEAKQHVASSMITADGSISVGWSPSQVDMLACDRWIME